MPQMIIDLMDPTNYNNQHYHDRFLSNMYRIVSYGDWSKWRLTSGDTI